MKSELVIQSEKNIEMLEQLRDNHLYSAAAVVRALVQKRIEATQAAIASETR